MLRWGSLAALLVIGLAPAMAAEMAPPAAAAAPAPAPVAAPSPTVRPNPLALGVTPVPPAFSATNRPRIGLVLGGGGAKGFAHIGVLRELERLHIPVDVVAGTSMGAVVGSMYAIGHDAEQVNLIAHNIDWQTIFNDRLSRDQLSFRRKQEDRRILLPYRLGFENGKPVLPKGVMGGQQLYATIQSLTVDWLATENFDKLPIPFRAVATNIVTGDPVALGDGSLSTAVFASMSIPAAFPPVTRDGLLLVDGGISDNLPVDVARAMGVDLVIVVDVGDPPMKQDQITSAFSVFGQMQLLLGYAAVRDQRASLGGRDVLILPDISNISALSFDKLDYGIELGVAAAKAQAGKLAALSVDDATWAQYLAERKARTDPSPIIVKKIEIANDSKVPDKQILSKVTVQPGEVLNGQQMKQDVQNIFAMDEFDRVYYDVISSDGADILQVNTRTNPAANKYFQFGLLVASDIGTQSQFDFAVAYTDRNFLGTGGEWRGFARFGSNILLDVALYKQFGGFFIEPAAFYQRDSSFIIRAGSVDGNQTLQLSRAGALFDFGWVFGNWGELRLGGSLGGLNLAETSEPTGLPPGWNTDTTIGAGFTYDTLDSVVFPRHGTRARIQYVDHVEALGSQFTRNTISAEIIQPVTFGATTLLFSARGGTTFDLSQQFADSNIGDFRLGGFLNLSGTPFNSLIGQKLAFGRIIGFHQLGQDAPILNIPVFVGASFEAGNVFAINSLPGANNGLIYAGSAFIGSDTPIGPVWLAYGRSSEGGAIYFVIGRLF
jgi:NTE family protein